MDNSTLYNISMRVGLFFIKTRLYYGRLCAIQSEFELCIRSSGCNRIATLFLCVMRGNNTSDELDSNAERVTGERERERERERKRERESLSYVTQRIWKTVELHRY
jgi:hypothetical protein